MTRRSGEAGGNLNHALRGCDLAVLTPDLGLASETFVRRHCNELLPQRTAAVARTQQPAWQPEGPSLLTDGLRPPPPSVSMRLARKLGLGAPVSTAEYAARETERFLREHGVRVLLGEYLHWCVELLPLARALGLPFWAHGHGYDVSAHLRNPHYRLAYLGFADAAGVIVVSDFSRRRLIQLGLPPEKVHVIPCGTDVPDQPPPPREHRDEIRCLAVGRMVPKKGTIYLLEAFRRAAEAQPSLCLDLVGGGELLPAAEQFVQAMGLNGRVTLHGEQPAARVRELLGDTDIFLHHAVTDPRSGDEEGLPVAILEAMAAALPVVTTRHAGIPEAVLNSQTGLLSDEGDAGAMAESILALSSDNARRRELGEAGWQRVRNQFSWSRERRDLLQLMGLSMPEAAPGEATAARRPHEQRGLPADQTTAVA